MVSGHKRIEKAAVAPRQRADDAGHAREHDRAVERFRDLVELLPAVVYEAEVGAEGNWLYISPQIERLLGYAPEEWVADPSLWAASLHPDDREEIIELELRDAKLARGGEVTVVTEYRMLHRDGSIVWVRDEARLTDPDGAEPHWRGVLIDITEARDTERALREANERFRSLINTMPVCIYHADPRSEAGREFVSPQLKKLLGYTPEEWAEDPSLWAASLHPDDRSRVLRDEERHMTMAVGTPWTSEYRLLHRSGEVIWVRDRAVLAEEADGHRLLQGIVTDVSSEHRADTGTGGAPDVLRLTCSGCGAVHAAEQMAACLECGSANVEAVSLNASLAELAATRARVELLLDGVQHHLETVGRNEKPADVAGSTVGSERRARARPSGGADHP
jgi:PAS domain S-box-containing protein